jgi:hypothetical protein
VTTFIFVTGKKERSKERRTEKFGRNKLLNLHLEILEKISGNFLLTYALLFYFTILYLIIA